MAQVLVKLFNHCSQLANRYLSKTNSLSLVKSMSKPNNLFDSFPIVCMLNSLNFSKCYYTNTDTNIDTNTDTNTDTNIDTNTETNPDTNADTNTVTNTYTNDDSNTNADTNIISDTNTITDTNTDTNNYTNTDTNAAIGIPSRDDNLCTLYL